MRVVAGELRPVLDGRGRGREKDRAEPVVPTLVVGRFARSAAGSGSSAGTRNFAPQSHRAHFPADPSGAFDGLSYSGRRTAMGMGRPPRACSGAPSGIARLDSGPKRRPSRASGVTGKSYPKQGAATVFDAGIARRPGVAPGPRAGYGGGVEMSRDVEAGGPGVAVLRGVVDPTAFRSASETSQGTSYVRPVRRQRRSRRRFFPERPRSAVSDAACDRGSRRSSAAPRGGVGRAP